MALQETWKPIIGYEGFYEVSNQGKIKSVSRQVRMKNGHTRTIHERIMRQQTQKNGYKTVTLSKNGVVARRISVHRLVALAFIPNPNDLPEVNHINEDKTDNRASNLEWCDRRYNNLYGSAKLRAIITQGKPVLQLKDGKIVNAWPSAGMAAAFTDATQGGISSCCRGEIKTSGGYEWKLAPWAK